MSRPTTERFPVAATDSPFAGIRRQLLSTEHVTVSRYTFDPGAAFPMHSHDQEQVTVVEEGTVRMSIEGLSRQMAPGDFAVSYAGEQHGIEAGEEGARLLAIISPPRASADEYEIASPG